MLCRSENMGQHQRHLGMLSDSGIWEYGKLPGNSWLFSFQTERKKNHFSQPLSNNECSKKKVYQWLVSLFYFFVVSSVKLSPADPSALPEVWFENVRLHNSPRPQICKVDFDWIRPLLFTEFACQQEVSSKLTRWLASKLKRNWLDSPDWFCHWCIGELNLIRVLCRLYSFDKYLAL